MGMLDDVGYYTIFMKGDQGMQVVETYNIQVNVDGKMVLGRETNGNYGGYP